MNRGRSSIRFRPLAASLAGITLGPLFVISTLLRARFWLFGCVVAGLGLLLAWDKHVQYEQSLTSFFPEGDPDVVAYERASALFGNDNLVFITYDDPELLSAAGMQRLAELTASVQPARIPAVIDVQSLDRMPLFWELDNRLIDLAKLPAVARNLAVRALGANVATLSQTESPFTVGGALQRANRDERAQLRERIVSHPLLAGTLVDRNGESAAVIVRLVPMQEQDPKETIQLLRAAADRFAEKHGLRRPALAGPPVLLADGFTAIETDGRRLAIVGLGLIGLVMLTVTRSIWWAMVPILSGWTVWRLAETLLALADVRLSLSGGPLSAQIIVLTMPAASHLAIHFRDALRHNAGQTSAARLSLSAVSIPIVWTAATGAIGYGALLTSRVVPVWQFGLILAICTLAASILTLAISPIAMLPPFPLELPVRAGSSSRLAGWLNAQTRAVINYPGRIVLAVVLVCLPLSAGMLRLQYESNYINAFKPKTRVRQDYAATEQRLGGIGVVSLVVPAQERFDLDALRAHQALDRALLGLKRDGQQVLTQVVSPATVLDPEGKISALPEKLGREALRIKQELIAASPQGALLSNFLVLRRTELTDTGWARVLLRISERESASIKEQTFARVLAQAKADPVFQTADRVPYIAGLSQLLTQTTRAVIDTSWVTFVWSAVGILAMLTLAFRGLGLALLAILPTFLSVGFVLGVTGLFGVPLDVATALVASVALGLSVDDTFHCLLQYRRHRAKLPIRESLIASYHLTGPGVLLSSLAVAVGFSVLRFGEFVPFSNFGLMVGVATLGSSLGNLVLLPACLALGARKPTAAVESPGTALAAGTRLLESRLGEPSA